MSSQLLINIPTSFTKFNTLLPLCPNDTNQIERDLISKLDRDLFSNTRKTGINTTVTTTFHAQNSHHQYIKPSTYNLFLNPSSRLSYLPSPPRSPKGFKMAFPTIKANMITPSPEQVKRRSSEVMTVASKIPLFRRRKTNYINKEVVSAENGPVVLKLCNINYPAAALHSSPNQYVNPTITIPSTQNNGRFTITIPSTKQRRFRCKTCSMAFTTSGHLPRHNRIHTGEKNYTCSYEGCGQKFSRHDNCLQHYRTHLKKQQRRKRK